MAQLPASWLVSAIGSTAFSVRAGMLGFVGGWIADDIFVGLASSFLAALLLTVGATWLTRHQAAPKQTSGAGDESENGTSPDTASAKA